MENTATHIYTKDGIICVKYDVMIKVNYELMGNWLINNNKIRNIKCCELCSAKHTIYIDNLEISGYDENHLYFTNNTYIKYENGELIKVSNIWNKHTSIDKYYQEDEKARKSLQLLANRLVDSNI